MKEIIFWIIDIVCLIIIICSTIKIFKNDREIDKMVYEIKQRHFIYLKSLNGLLTPSEALDLINEVVTLPPLYYLGIDDDLLKVTLYKRDKKMPNQMGIVVGEFILNSYKANELISFGLEVLKFIGEKEAQNELSRIS
ncbi:MAG TPA: hypothetical protein IAB27_05370 [Candidatus Coprosoma intestinipullorum]|uniref:Uncharacterized protein n=1 Tax=Candidatus Coprosoma intestinipullorum TaxID=2840752 RepID=A0A9D0ZRU1_9FIRM|nr:hypothetical protein [Candidatus Coprosoma intestinipullorum]